MTSLLSFNSIASFFRELIEAQLRPLPGTETSARYSDEDDDDRVDERELEYFYWGLFPVY
ncbi:hypothetical protein NOF55_13645 [Rhizobiaceae bacterium BDR2-2]|uniref:Uncharacterized protein n=1 Tax=Ectorhizobium quercum TaxID=2965071 RepID=A0AAE3SVB4_9HYPH|nr:hypothetical protein [Ectorhizobium quercum]MCX8998150.1 hypothetical protein [Ectorhizobium quercum]